MGSEIITMAVYERKNFQHAKESREKSIQKDIFADFKKLIIFNLTVGCLFFIFSVITFFISDEFKNIFVISLVLFAVIAIIFSCRVMKKLKKAEDRYRQFGEKVIKKAEQN